MNNALVHTVVALAYPLFCVHRTRGKSYKHFTLVNYDSRVVPDWKIPHITTLIHERKMFIRLATEVILGHFYT